jgi:hypothetical protein
MNLRETGREDGEWIELAQHGVKYWPFVNMLMNLRIPWVVGCMLKGLATISRPRRLVHRKGKVTPALFLTEHHAMKASWGVEVQLHALSDLGIRWRWVVSFTSRLLYPQGKSRRYSLDRRLRGPQSRSGGGGEEKNNQPLPELEPPIIQPVA